MRSSYSRGSVSRLDGKGPEGAPLIERPVRYPLPTPSARQAGELSVIDHILRFMTLGTVIIGCIAILTALYTNNRRLGADIFLKYSDRISDLRRRLPMTAFVEGSVYSSLEMAPEERRVAHEIIYSIFELFELRVHGFFPSAVWKRPT